jgi:DNA polymerase II small subunit/DNA polymerase delta subunit B
MCKRALVFNRTDYLCNIHAYYMHTNIHRKTLKERERERAREGWEEEKEREHQYNVRLDVHASAWSQSDKWTTLEETQIIEPNDIKDTNG